MECSKIVVTPNCESGLMAQRPENTVMQALEALSESQVNNFLSGKTPLNLNMRFGDQMMLIQLQLSTVDPTNGAVKNCASLSRRGTQNRVYYHQPRSGRVSTPFTTTLKPSCTTGIRSVPTQRQGSAGSKNILRCHQYPLNNNISATSNSARVTVPSPTPISTSDCKVKIGTRLTPLHNRNIIRVPGNGVGVGVGLKKSWPFENCEAATKKNIVPKIIDFKGIGEAHLAEPSPIKSLSNLVTSSTKAAAAKSIPHVIQGTENNCYSNPSFNYFSAPIVTSTTTTKTTTTTLTALEPRSHYLEKAVASCRDPIAAKLTSCLCTRLNDSNLPQATCSKSNHNSGNLNPAQQQSQRPQQIPIRHIFRNQNYWQIRPKVESATNCAVLKKLNTINNKGVATNVNSNFTPPSTSSGSATHLKATKVCSSLNKSPEPKTTSSSRSISKDFPSNTTALADASRNLTQTLEKLSKEIFSSKSDFPIIKEATRKCGASARIESMKKYGKGLYSGTFSGRLNPALQDRNGRPKRGISTVIHMINDLLSSTPRGTRITVRKPDTSRISSAADSNGSLSSMHNTSKSSKETASISILKSAGSDGTPVYSVSVTTGTPHHNQEKASNDPKVCQCSFGRQGETDPNEGEYTCPKCISDLTNMKTKSKMKELRLAMQQRKQNRENRKAKGAPYEARLLEATAATPVTSNVNEMTSDTLNEPVSVTTSTTQSNDTTGA